MKIVHDYGQGMKDVVYSCEDAEHIKKDFRNLSEDVVDRLCEWLKSHNQLVIANACADAGSGWQGSSFKIGTADLSGNGYCLSDESINSFLNGEIKSSWYRVGSEQYERAVAYEKQIDDASIQEIEKNKSIIRNILDNSEKLKITQYVSKPSIISAVRWDGSSEALSKIEVLIKGINQMNRVTSGDSDGSLFVDLYIGGVNIVASFSCRNTEINKGYWITSDLDILSNDTFEMLYNEKT